MLTLITGAARFFLSVTVEAPPIASISQASFLKDFYLNESLTATSFHALKKISVKEPKGCSAE